MTDVRRRLAVSMLVFGGLAFAAVLAAPLIGTTPIRLGRAFDRSIPFADNVDAQIFFIARLPRALAGALVGATLAAAGVVFQALLRNPLATPFTLGVSAGSALGAMLAITLRLHLSFWGVSAVTAASFAGSLGAVGIVYAHGPRPPQRLLDERPAARGRDAERVLLGADPVRAVRRRLGGGAAHGALADGRPRRRRLRADPGRPAALRGRLRRVRLAAAGR